MKRLIARYIYLLPVVLLIFALPVGVVTAQEADSVAVVDSVDKGEEFFPANVKFFTMDVAALRYDEEHVQLDVYALIDRFFLKAEEVENGVEARAQILVKVFDKEGNLITGDTWVRSDFAASNEERKAGQKIPELIQYVVKPGDYRIEMTIADLISRMQRTEDVRVNASSFGMDGLLTSDIIIASRIEKAGEGDSEFNHNGLLVLPNADRIFGGSVSNVFYYMEIYNLTAGEGGTYTVHREIQNTSKKKLITLPTKQRPAPAPDLVDYDSFSIVNLPTGQYELLLTVTDNVTGNSVQKVRMFWVYQPNMEVTTQAMIIPDPGFDIAAMSDEEIDKELEQVKYIMTPRVQRIVNELAPESRRSFLAKFWLANDPDTSTTENELRIEYMHRVRTANERYNSFRREGWTTDRGRVYCMLGEPSFVEDHPFDVDVGKAYLIWTYDHIEGGVMFVFVDRNAYGDYVQVHSTMKGELNNSNWYEQELGIEY